MKCVIKGENIFYWCDGCNSLHNVPVKSGEPGRDWSCNMDVDKPTLQPSVKEYFPAHDTIPEKVFCHHFLIEGNIQYCSDSPHELKGKTVPLRDLSEIRNNSSDETILEYINRMIK